MNINIDNHENEFDSCYEKQEWAFFNSNFNFTLMLFSVNNCVPIQSPTTWLNAIDIDKKSLKIYKSYSFLPLKNYKNKKMTYISENNQNSLKSE